jgi:hypothetical protein
MKKLIALVAVVAISFTVVAQNAPSTSPAPKQAMAKPVKDMMIMRQGKMMIFKDSHLSPMEKPMTMKNGTVITPNGMMTMKNGTTKQLIDGERLDMDGNMMGNKMQATPTTPQK